MNVDVTTWERVLNEKNNPSVKGLMWQWLWALGVGLGLCAHGLGCADDGVFYGSAEVLSGGSSTDDVSLAVETVGWGAGEDTSVSDGTETPDVSESDAIAPGAFGYPCETNTECLSGWCVDSPAGIASPFKIRDWM